LQWRRNFFCRGGADIVKVTYRNFSPKILKIINDTSMRSAVMIIITNVITFEIYKRLLITLHLRPSYTL